MKIIITDCTEQQGKHAVGFLTGRKPLLGLMCSVPSVDITVEYRSSVSAPVRPLHHYLGDAA